MTTLLYEQWSGGHYDNYLNCLVPRVSQLSDRVIVAVPRATLNNKVLIERWSACKNVDFFEIEENVNPQLNIKDRYAAALNLVNCMKAVHPSYTMLPSADAQSTGLSAMSIFGLDIKKKFGPLEGTLHYGYGNSAETLKQRMKEFIYTSTYKNLSLSSLNFVNFMYYEYFLSLGVFKSDKVKFVGDPVPQNNKIGKIESRRRLGLDVDGRYIGIIGSLDSRKAIPELLAAFRYANLESKDRLLLAGRLDTKYAKLIENSYQDLVKDGRLIVLNRFLSNDELAYGYEALDLAAIVYYNFPGLASLALKAVCSGNTSYCQQFWVAACTNYTV